MIVQNRKLFSFVILVLIVATAIYSWITIRQFSNALDRSSTLHLEVTHSMLCTHLQNEWQFLESVRHLDPETIQERPFLLEAKKRSSFWFSPGLSGEHSWQKDLSPAFYHFFHQQGQFSNYFQPTGPETERIWVQIANVNNMVVFQSSTNIPVYRQEYRAPLPPPLSQYSMTLVCLEQHHNQHWSSLKLNLHLGSAFAITILLLLLVWYWSQSMETKLHLAKQKTALLSTISHEFKTPLSVIKIAAETLLGKRFRTAEEESQFTSRMILEVDRLNSMVQKIMDFKDVGEGLQRLTLVPLDARNIARHSFETFQSRQDMKDAIFSLDCASTPCTIKGDANMLIHALDNLLENAYKYSHQEKRVHLSCFIQGKYVVLKVKDQGIGIDEREKKLIFQTFYRIRNKDTVHIKGSGIGLAFVRQIIHSHGGHIDLDSQPARGSTFSIKIPYVPDTSSTKIKRGN